MKRSLERRIPGSARVPRVRQSDGLVPRRAGFGVPPKQSFLKPLPSLKLLRLRKVREGEDAFASTRDACATRIIQRAMGAVL
jgi:hypothetical protein